MEEKIIILSSENDIFSENLKVFTLNGPKGKEKGRKLEYELEEKLNIYKLDLDASLDQKQETREGPGPAKGRP